MAKTQIDGKGEPTSYELLPAEGHPELGVKVFELLGEIVADKTALGLHDAWYERYRLSRNMPFKGKVKKVPLLSANLLHTHRARTVNTLTDNNPTFNLAKVGGVSEGEDEALQNLQRTAEHWWRETEQQGQFASSVSNGEMYGTAIEKIVFDKELEYGIGDVRTVIVDPYHFGFYPVTAKKSQDADGNFHFYPMSLREAKRRWPQHADKIKADSDILKELGDNRREVGGEISSSANKLQRCLTAIASWMGSSTASDNTDDNVLICEAWVKDRSEKVVSEEDDGNGGKIQITEPKYKGHIRRVTACSGGTVVLSDQDNPNINPTLPIEKARITYLFDKFPFIMATSIEDSCSAWGQSDWEQLEGLQKEFSKTLSQFAYFKDKAVRPKVINPRDSGVDNSEFTTSMNILNPSSAAVAAGIKYLEMNNTGLMAEVSGSLDIIKQLFFLVAGTFELDQAQTGSGVTAYKAIAALLEHAATMMRGKIRSYQMLARETGRMYLSHVQNFYTEERSISFEDDGQTQISTIKGSEMIVPAKLTVVSGSTMPRSEITRREEAISLHAAGIIDQPEVLRVLDWPNRAAVIKRMQAGPIGMMAERLKAAGFPPELLDLFVELASMEEKDFKKMEEAGEVPQLNLPGGEQQADPQEELTNIVQRSEARKSSAEADLAVEKVVTERIDQQRVLAGIQFDSEKLDQERIKIRADVISNLTNRPGYNEKGMKSNNVTSK